MTTSSRSSRTPIYICAITGVPKEEIYATLYEVNKDLILDHFENTSKEFDIANGLIERFYDLYFHGVTDFSGPRHQTEDSQILRRPDAGITMGVWDGIELGGAAQYSGM